jgi:phosphinothricin acetyltransferase
LKPASISTPHGAGRATANAHRCFTSITLPNDASLALHRAFGFEEVGTMREAGFKPGKFWDVHWLQRGM